jgi:RimJ/RimL family protein N-acetyltransferase
MKVRAAPAEHYPWMATHTSWRPTSGFRAIEALDDGLIRGMVGYDLWTPNSVQMHIALATPAACRPLLFPAFAYPFLEVGLGMVLGTVPANNLASVHFARKLGFREAHRTADGWKPGVDLIHFEMRREECRHLLSTRKAA